ncbi:MAG: hypothetical protein H7336_12940 [Bacteriovorax sp.]|nr:hypothetical protein [Bacteriovorax sp.]
MNRFLIPLCALLLMSCARVQTLNMVSHNYSERPQRVLWIQVAGFSEEHIPLLRFNVSEAARKTNLEQVDCVGKMWNYNLYQLRPDAAKSFISQINGSKNIKGTCEDYESLPTWSYLQDIGYSVGVLENGASKEQSLESSLGCSNNKTIDLAKMRYWKMGPDATSASQKTFHYQDSPEQSRATVQPGLYYDRSCQKGICYSTLSNNFKTMWNLINKDNSKTFVIVRDFNFQNALKRKDIGLAKEALQEIDRLISVIDKSKSSELLIIVSGAESLPIEFPAQGKPWSDFEKSGKNIIYKTSSLMSPVLATGAMSENFCGIFDESEMMKRIIYRPEGKIFNSDVINPF